MARPREFDPESVLDRAMEVFWAKGYEATSLDDLCDATRLNRSSLYSSFGDKRKLFLDTLDRYADRSVARLRAALARPGHINENISRFLTELIDQIVTAPGRRGCFIGNCAAEIAPHDRGAAVKVRGNLERIEALFREAFVQAKRRDELPVDADATALARFFVAGIQGLRLVGKTGPDRSVLEDTVAIMMRCLRA